MTHEPAPPIAPEIPDAKLAQKHPLPFGPYLIRETRGSLLVSSPSFDSDLRDFARQHLAQWDRDGSAWKFSFRKLPRVDLYDRLQRLALRQLALAQQNSTLLEQLRQRQQLSLFSFESPALQIQSLDQGERLSARFKYHSPWIDRIKQIRGARWQSDSKSWNVPLLGLPILEDIARELMSARQQLADRNAPFHQLESESPLEATIARSKHGPLAQVLYLPASHAYVIDLTLSTRSILGSVLFSDRKELETEPSLSPLFLERPVPAVEHNSWVLDCSQRPLIERLFSTAARILDELAPTLEISAAPLRSAVRSGLIPHDIRQNLHGVVAFQNQQAFLLRAGSLPASGQVLAHPLSHAQTLHWLSVNPQSRRFCLTLSQIDEPALASYLDAMELHEIAPPSGLVKKIRL